MRVLGLIRERNWYGEDGMEHLRTVKKPEQAIPTFEQTIALLMKVRQNLATSSPPLISRTHIIHTFRSILISILPYRNAANTINTALARP